MTTLPSPAREVAERLSLRALDVCRVYLSNGRRCGAYWSVGDVHNAPGRSLYVRLTGPSSGPGAAGHWTDAATGEHGDLIDLVRLSQGLSSLADTLDEARRFLSLPPARPRQPDPVPRNSAEAARRLFAIGRPVSGTLAERYLRSRGITAALDCAALRFHAGVYCRERGRDAALPALLAAVTDLSGRVTAVQRTWLETPEPRKARLVHPRRSLGCQLGHGVRFAGTPGMGRVVREVLVAGEGLETVLSLKSALPALPMIAALSANHLGALLLPRSLRRLYIARDCDHEGLRAARRLRERAEALGVEVLELVPLGGDFNADLRRFGPVHLQARLRPLLALPDAVLAGWASAPHAGSDASLTKTATVGANGIAGSP